MDRCIWPVRCSSDTIAVHPPRGGTFMSRLDQHVRLVQSKMVLDTWLRALVWAGIIFFGVLTLAVIVQRVIAHYLPHPAIWLWVGVGLSIAGAVIYAMMRRPTLHEAAVAIDD